MTADLVQFLRARLDEDEEAAQKAAALCGCHPAAPSWTFRDGDEETDGRILIHDDPHPVLLGKRRRLARRWNRSCDGLFAAQHIVRHDPARVLTEVDAKRRLLAVHQRDTRYSFSGCITCDAGENSCGCMGGSAYEYPCETLRLLALPYADHPDYRQEWKP
ncbi:DUF6221 family protein [Streptomyces sp. 4.24]|uniref:DUF6221 family protein n=1 Tax=Streptomyces tritrimontium TaxID=3406573 RepID=UPI003BB5610A